jgi:heme exporter protein D
MQFDSLTSFLVMDGHGVFVWSVYAITLVVLLSLAISPLRRQQRFFIEEAMRQRRQQVSE